jgi:dTDP-3-amino-3,4,6-trideoxy-alpha-D-glucose transaminase
MMERIPMILANDFRRQWQDLQKDTLDAVQSVGESGWYVLGDQVRAFEASLAAYWGLQHAAGVANGLDAIEIALRVLGCRPGDRVLTTPLSAFATTLAIVKVGAIPVFVDTDERGLIDLDCCAALLGKRPEIRFFVPVHLYGHALDSLALRAMQQKFDLRLIEDCAQSAGARFGGDPTGHIGQMAATSFYPTKNLGAMGDGGAVLTNSAAFDAQVRVFRFYGETARYRHEQIGYNSRLDELHAAILLKASMPRLPRWIERRRAIAAQYSVSINNPAVRLLTPAPGSQPSWHLFPVFVEAARREHFLAHLKNAGIGTGIHYPVAIPDQPAMRQVPFETADDCAVARRLCATEVSIPIHPYLSDDEVERVAGAVNSWISPS